MSMGLMMAVLYLGGLSRGWAVTLLGIALTVSIFTEVSRLKNPSINAKLIRFWGPIMRSCEAERCSGIPFYLSSSLLAVAIFPQHIAVLSILYLAIGDPIASLMGLTYGQNSWKIANGKSLVGTASGMLACAFTTAVFLMAWGYPPALVGGLALLGGLAGGLAELLPLEVDDNFSIPMVSGFILWFTWILLGL